MWSTDSKATNPHATLSALSGFAVYKPVQLHWLTELFGGQLAEPTSGTPQGPWLRTGDRRQFRG